MWLTRSQTLPGQCPSDYGRNRYRMGVRDGDRSGVTVPLPSPGGHQGAADRQLEPRGLMEGGSLSFFLLHLGVGVAAGLPSPFPSTGPNFTRKTSPVTSGHQLLPLMVIKFTLQPTIFSVLGVATLNILGGGPPFAKENALSSFTLFWQINPPAS